MHISAYLLLKKNAEETIWVSHGPAFNTLMPSILSVGPELYYTSKALHEHWQFSHLPVQNNGPWTGSYNKKHFRAKGEGGSCSQSFNISNHFPHELLITPSMESPHAVTINFFEHICQHSWRTLEVWWKSGLTSNFIGNLGHTEFFLFNLKKNTHTQTSIYVHVQTIKQKENAHSMPQ